MKLYNYFLSFQVKNDAFAPIFSHSSIKLESPINSHGTIKELEKGIKEQFGHTVSILFFTLLSTEDLNKSDDNQSTS